MSSESVEYLLSSQAVRERCHGVLQKCREGFGRFTYHASQRQNTVEYVVDVIRKRHPDLNIPYHSRWSHFSAGGLDRVKEIEGRLGEESVLERVIRKIDLVIVSVLLDAGAGQWEYRDAVSSKVIRRSEGLAVASFNMFCSGGFSSDPQDPLRVDSHGLCELREETLASGFQSNSGNPLPGLEGRLTLMKQLGKILEAKTEYFSCFKSHNFRPGHIIYHLKSKYPDKRLPAAELLKIVLLSLGEIWPGRCDINGTNLGDAWPCEILPKGANIVPFHKLSQWLTYSLLEPLEEAGFEVIGLNDLTGLAEYRNGGLLLDTGLIEPVNPDDLHEEHSVSSELVVQWRALTVALLDELAVEVCRQLNVSPEEFPLVKVLEGGTWWAGRMIAKEKRESGEPPLKVISDGTVF